MDTYFKHGPNAYFNATKVIFNPKCRCGEDRGV